MATLRDVPQIIMAEKQQSYERLADIVEQHLDMDKLMEIMGENNQ